MSVIVEAHAIRLVGRCLVEDAEPLLAALREYPERPIEMGNAQKLHLALVQILLAAGRDVIGRPHDPTSSYVNENSGHDTKQSTR